MKNFKRAVTLTAAILMMSAASVTVSAAYASNAEIVAGLTGMTVEEVIAEVRATGSTYGTIANNAGKLEEFQKESLELRKDILAQRVAAGFLTQAEADAAADAIAQNQLICNGTGYGAGYGYGCGGGMGRGMGRGFGGGWR